MAARAAGSDHCRRALVSGYHAVWLVCEGLCHIQRRLWTAQRGDCIIGVVLYCFSDCSVRSGVERAMVSQNSGNPCHGEKDIPQVSITESAGYVSQPPTRT